MKNFSQQTRINFLPDDLRPSLVSSRSFSLLLTFVFLGLPVTAMTVKGISLKLGQDRLAAFAERDSIAMEIGARGEKENQNNDQRSISAAKKAFAEKIYWAAIFKELSNVAPKSLWLTEFETKVSGETKSVVISGNSTSQSDIADFLANLESSYFFRNVQMRYSQAEDDMKPVQYKFQFEGQIFEPVAGAINAKN